MNTYRKLLKTLALTAVVSASLAATASAAQLSPLSKASARGATETQALESAHRIWRMTDTTVSVDPCRRYSRLVVMCYATVGLHFSTSECVSPVEASVEYTVTKLSRSRVEVARYAQWEVDPGGNGAEAACAAEREAEASDKAAEELE